MKDDDRERIELKPCGGGEAQSALLGNNVLPTHAFAARTE